MHMLDARCIADRLLNLRANLTNAERCETYGQQLDERSRRHLQRTLDAPVLVVPRNGSATI